MSPGAQSRNDTPAAANTVSAKRHVGQLLRAGDGVKGRSRRLPVRAAQPLRPSLACSMLKQPCDRQGKLRPKPPQPGGVAAAPSTAAPAPPGCSAAAAARRARAADAARRQPAAPSPSASAAPTAACSRRSSPGCTVWILSNTRNGKRHAFELNREPAVRVVHHLDLLAHQSTRERRRVQQQHHPVVMQGQVLRAPSAPPARPGSRPDHPPRSAAGAGPWRSPVPAQSARCSRR